MPATRSHGLLGLEGKVAVVTGATSGIGEALALRLAGAGATVLGIGHDPTRLEAAQRRFEARSTPGHVDLLLADVSIRAGVWAIHEGALRRYPKVDLLVNNAGMIFSEREETGEGVERTWALNVVGPYRVTVALRDLLEVARGARVVNVASAAHRGARLDLDDPEGRRRYRGYSAYARSKVALILLTREFARRWADTGIEFFSVHPGFVRSRFAHNSRGGAALAIRFLARAFGISPDRGAETPFVAATDPQLAGQSGSYLARRHVVTPSARARNCEMGVALFDRLSTAYPVGTPNG